ncbi:MAG: flavin reductase [Clostridia bacterium]|nr:flavin reductase [Clostridia bacterium]
MPNIDNNAIYKLSYGLFVLTAKQGDKDNGCIINTAMQVTATPLQIVIAVNKDNYTHGMIADTGEFNLSVISTAASFELFKHFGFQSGRNTDKFADFAAFERAENGVAYVTQGTNAVLGAKVVSSVDCGTHTLFMAEVTFAKELSKDSSMTYEYYFANVKPKPAANGGSKKKFVCKICGYVHEAEELPADFTCPLCKHPASDFEEVPAEKKKKKFVCKICGYVHEAEELPADFTCPLCKHPASDFEEV